MQGQRGVSLVELVVVLVVLALVTALGQVSLSAWTQSMRLRTASESFLLGLQLARSEAIKRNATVSFSLVDRDDEGCALSNVGSDLSIWSWVINVGNAVDCRRYDDSARKNPNPNFIQLRSSREAGTSQLKVRTDRAVVRFDGLGLAHFEPPAEGEKMSLDLFMGSLSECTGGENKARCLRVVLITPNGGVRICDPAVTTVGDERKCP